jgi:hypothetical protein
VASGFSAPALGGRVYLRVAAQLPSPTYPLGTRPSRTYGLPHLSLRAYLPALPLAVLKQVLIVTMELDYEYEDVLRRAC